MGEPAMTALNDLELPLAQQIEWKPGEIQPLTDACDVLVTPNIDDSLDAEDSKRDFGPPSARSASGGVSCPRTKQI